MFSLQYIQACRSTSNTIPARLEKLVSVSELREEEMAHCLELGVTPSSLVLCFAGEALGFPFDPTVLLIHYLCTGKA